MTNNPVTKTMKNKAARPFIKWVGGKSQLLGQFAQHYPHELVNGNITRYVEPFLGGGAVFLDIAQNYKIEDAFLSDINPELILVYEVVKRNPYGLIELLVQHKNDYYSKTDKEREIFYYEIRTRYNEQSAKLDNNIYSEEWIIRAARMIFLNKTCFNGLYRLNSKGEFNAPFGWYKKPAIVNKDKLLQVSHLLQDATLHTGSFQDCRRYIHDSTFVYFDPPYRPLSTTSNFTSYSTSRFDDSDQIELADFFRQIDQTCAAKLMLSNSDPKNVDVNDNFFEELYAPFNVHRVRASRMINSDANGRGKISEILVTNY
jgi:DNA adenine methylase